MPAPPPAPELLATPAGDVPLQEYRLGLAGRAWGVLHTGAVLSWVDEQHYLSESRERLPYGAALWPAAIALAHEVAARPDEWAGRRVLELGAGTGLPGIVAASLGAHVVQTDKHALALALCERNGARNGAPRGSLAYRRADWAAWDVDERFDWIVGADVCYAEGLHDALRGIFARNLAPGGRVLLTDPFRSASLRLFEAMEADGWAVTVARWSVGLAEPEPGRDPDETAPRGIGAFALAPPAGG
jgi:predicted nicotinamide N-methyase